MNATTDVLELFRRRDALLDGHFVLSSGLHSPGYLQCARVLQHPDHAAACGAAIADRVRDWRVSVVVSPALGGVVIGHEVARALGVRAVFVERREGVLCLRRGFQIESGERVLVVEDVVTTGGSTRETIEVVQAAGGAVVGAAAIINRSGIADPVGVPFAALADLSLPTFDPAECQLCRAGQPITRPGSRA